MTVRMLIVTPLGPCPPEKQFRGQPTFSPSGEIDRRCIGARCKVYGRDHGIGSPPDRLIVTADDPRFIRGAQALREGFFPTTPTADWKDLPPHEVDSTIESWFASESGQSDPLGHLILSYAIQSGARLILICGENILRWIGAYYRIFPSQGGPVLVTAEIDGGEVKATIVDLGGFSAERAGGPSPRFTTTVPDIAAPTGFIGLRLIPGGAA